MQAIFSIDENNHPIRMDMAPAELEGRDLQELLEKNWDLLPGDLIAGTDNQPLRWAMIKREAPVESPLSGEARWSLDFLFGDDQAIPTFVECKLHKNPEGRREIIGQMFEYVANAQHYWNIGTLKSFVPADFERHIWNRPLDEYFTEVLDNLKRGKVRMVFFMDQAPRELKSTVMFLNQALTEAEVMIVEARHFRHGEKKFVVPSLFGYTEQVRADKEKRIEKLSGTGSSGSGKWTLEQFNAATELLDQITGTAVRKLRDYVLEQKFDLNWGRGKYGSMNVILSHLSSKSLFSIYTSGGIGINLGWLDGEVRSQFDSELRNAGFAYSEKLQYAVLKSEQWVGSVDKFVAVVERMKAYSINGGLATHVSGT